MKNPPEINVKNQVAVHWSLKCGLVCVLVVLVSLVNFVLSINWQTGTGNTSWLWSMVAASFSFAACSVLYVKHLGND
jgi:hypothetical protein